MIPVLFFIQASKLDLCLESVICRIRRCKGQFSSGAVFGKQQCTAELSLKGYTKVEDRSEMQFLLQAFHEVVFRSIKERKFGVTYICCMPLSD